MSAQQTPQPAGATAPPLATPTRASQSSSGKRPTVRTPVRPAFGTSSSRTPVGAGATQSRPQSATRRLSDSSISGLRPVNRKKSISSRQADICARLSSGQSSPRNSPRKNKRSTMVPVTSPSTCTAAETPAPMQSPLPTPTQRVFPTAPPDTAMAIFWTDYWSKANPKPLNRIACNAPIALIVTEYHRDNTYSEKKAAREIMRWLFDRDHIGSGKHWSSDGCDISAGERSADGNSISFKVSCSSTWDWKDIYSVATSSAIIEFTHDFKVYIYNYKYYCAG